MSLNCTFTVACWSWAWGSSTRIGVRSPTWMRAVWLSTTWMAGAAWTSVRPCCCSASRKAASENWPKAVSARICRALSVVNAPALATAAIELPARFTKVCLNFDWFCWLWPLVWLAWSVGWITP